MSGDDHGKFWPIAVRKPPVSVRVRLGSLLTAPVAAKPRNGVMGVGAYGLEIGDEVPGELRRWLRTSDGEWIGEVTVTLLSRNGKAEVETVALVPAALIRRA